MLARLLGGLLLKSFAKCNFRSSLCLLNGFFMQLVSFPLSVEQFLPIIEVVSRTGKHFHNLRRFFDTKLPPGFPVGFSLPAAPTVTAKFHFGDVQMGAAVAKTGTPMAVPDDYTDLTADAKDGRFFKAFGEVQ